MDQEEIKNNIALYYSRLPKEAQEMFSKMEWLDQLKKINIKYNLSEKQSLVLATETSLILLGVTSVLEFETVLAKDSEIPRDTLDQIITDVKESILKPVESMVSRTYNENIEGEKKDKEVQNLEADLGNKFQKLPKNIQDAIKGSNYYDNLYAVAEKHNLNVAQMGALEEIVTGAIVGEINSEKISALIKERVRVSEEASLAMVEEVNKDILRPIRDKMMTATVGAKTNTAPKEVTQIKRSEEMILKKAGIEINPPKKEASPSVFEQKFSGSFKTTTVETDHSLNSLVKGPIEIPEKTGPAAVIPPRLNEVPKSTPDIKPKPEKPKTSSYAGKDPYRMSPEE